MRDINRIKPFVEELERVWSELPDWRFGQLMSNFLGFAMTKTGRDIFFIEDYEMLEVLKGYINSLTSGGQEVGES